MARTKNLSTPPKRTGTRLARATRTPLPSASATQPKQSSQERKQSQRPTPKKCPKKRRQYSAKRMDLAVLELRNNPEECKSAVAEKYGVPRSTLVKKVTKKLPDYPVALGRKPVLDPLVEDELVQLLRCAALRGYPFSVNELREMVFHYCKTYDVANSFNEESMMAGKKWWRLFKRRHPQLTIKKAENLSKARALGMDRETVSAWFEKLRLVFDAAGVWENPQLAWNMDESALVTVPNSKSRVVSFTDIRCQAKIVSAERGTLTTLIAACSASGAFVPPMLIMKGKRVNPDWFKHVPPGTCIDVTDSGWSDREMFYRWMQHFVAHMPPIPEGKKLVLILDGHGTHANLPALKLARDQNIEILCLPPHTTNHLQPLDKCVFGPMKTSWETICDNYMKNHRTELKGTITLPKVPKLFCLCWNRSAKPQNATSGFKHTGIFPLDPDALDNNAFLMGDADIATAGEPHEPPSVSTDAETEAAPAPDYDPYLFFDEDDGRHTPPQLISHTSPLVSVMERQTSAIFEVSASLPATSFVPEISQPTDNQGLWVGEEVVIAASPRIETNHGGDYALLKQMSPEPTGPFFERDAQSPEFDPSLGGFASDPISATTVPEQCVSPPADAPSSVRSSLKSSHPPSISGFFRATVMPQSSSRQMPPEKPASSPKYHMTSANYLKSLEDKQKKQKNVRASKGKNVPKTKDGCTLKKPKKVRRRLPMPSTSSATQDKSSIYSPCAVCKSIDKAGANWIKCDDCDMWQHDTCPGKATKRFFFCIKCAPVGS